MSSAPPRPSWLAGLRPRLTLLLGLTLLPVTGLLIGSALQSHDLARRDAEAELGRTAEVMAQTQAQTIANARTLLAVLAQLPEVRQALDGQTEACHTRLAAVLELHPDYQGLAVADSNGDVVCLGSNPVAQGNIGDRRSFQEALATAGFAVGDFQITRPWNTPGLSLAYPIQAPDGTVQAVVAAALSLEALNRAAETVLLPDDSVLTVLDQDGTVLMRVPESEKWVGQESGQAPLGAAVLAGNGISTTRGLDAVLRVYAFLPVPGTGSGRLGLALGRPPVAVYGTADNLLRQGILGTGLILALALLATWLLSQPLILRPVDRLLHATRRLASGDLTARTTAKPSTGELGQLAMAFDVMAATLEQREAERGRLYDAEHAARAQAELAAEEARRSAAEARRSAERTARLQSVTAMLSQTLTPKAVIEVVYQQCMEMMSADAGAVVLMAEDGVTLEVARTGNFPPGSVLPTLPLSSSAPAAEVVRTGRALWLETLDEYADQYPEYIERRRLIGFESVAYVPLSIETRVLGTLAVNFATRHTFDPAERELLLALGRQGAQALERTRLFQAERLARTEAETAQKRLAVLGEASTVVNASRSPAATLQSLADLLVPDIADVVSLFELNEGGQLVLAVHAAADPAQAGRLRAAEATLRPLLEGLPGALGRAMRGGRAVLLNQLPPGTPAGLSAAAAQLIQALALRSAIVAPLLAPGRALGGMVLAFTSDDRQYSPDDIGFADELARRAALGLENSRLFAEAQALNAELEARVNRRTVELVNANTSLEAEVAERKRVEHELANSREQLRGLTAHLQATREEERARISREIHDELGGALTGLKMDVAAIRRNLGETEAQRLARLEALSAQIDVTVQTVRRIATDLRPALLDDFGLAAAMEWQLSEFKVRAGLDGRFVTNAEDLVWNAEGSIALFRIFQEALTNVARHAQATRVEVSLTRTNEELDLKVQDDGRGIRPVDQASAKSLGLAGIRERVRLLDGKCDITGEPGSGTTVLIRLPLGRVSRERLGTGLLGRTDA